MRQKLITLCPITWELAQKKPNFSAWIRDQLRSERNRRDFTIDEVRFLEQNIIKRYKKIENETKISNQHLLHHLEQRTPEEIKALVAILENGFNSGVNY